MARRLRELVYVFGAKFSNVNRRLRCQIYVCIVITKSISAYVYRTVKRFFFSYQFASVHTCYYLNDDFLLVLTNILSISVAT